MFYEFLYLTLVYMCMFLFVVQLINIRKYKYKSKRIVNKSSMHVRNTKMKIILAKRIARKI